ncbi:MAG: hypothetical protein AAGH88_02160 [Planctomycetota bacterium]
MNALSKPVTVFVPIRRVLVMMMMTSLIAACPGCGAFKNPIVAYSDDGELLPNPGGKGLVVSPAPYIPDVPIPVGFKIVASQSSSSFDGRVRTVYHYYQGRANPGETVAFYQAHLPRNQWEFVTTSTGGQTTTLRYVKGPESLALSVRHVQGVSSVTVEIGG